MSTTQCAPSAISAGERERRVGGAARVREERFN